MENKLDQSVDITHTLATDLPICLSKSEISSDIPFLCDETTEYMSRIKVMVIMRGLPGSGKTTIVNNIKLKFPMAMSCSADDYFIQDGVYTFDNAKLQEAHENSFQLARQLATCGTAIIIVDNTNLCRRFMRVYFNIAKENHYVVVIVSPKTDWTNDLEQLVVRSKRSLTLSCLKEKMKLYKDIFPMYWGWFFNDNEYTGLTDLAEKYFPVCLQYVPELYRYLRYHMKDDKDLTFDALYSDGKAPVPGRQLHCTAFYAGPNGQDNPDVVEYANRKAVKLSIGKSCMLTVVGIFITPRTVGARVCLTTEQLEVWKSDPMVHSANNVPEHAEHTILPVTSNVVSTQYDPTGKLGNHVSESVMMQCVSKKSVDDWILLDTSDVSHPNEVTTDPSTEILLASDDLSHIPSLPPGSRAHMTLGCAEGIQAVQTGFDLLDILRCEIVGEPFHIDGVLLSYYGQGRCTVYFDKPRYIHTIFSGKY